MSHLAGPSVVAGFSSFLRFALVSMAAILALTHVAPAGNWPAWRGDGSGISTEKGLSTQWDTTTNIVWKATVGGEGNSSPIVWDGRVYLTSALDKGKNRLVLCYDANGHEAWRRQFDVEKVAPTYPKNGYASATPTTDGEKVYAFFDSPGLVALNAKTGKVAWQLDLGPFKTDGYMAASPILVRDVVIVVCDVNATMRDGKWEKNGFIVAVDKATGQERWRMARRPSAHAATPLAISVGGKTQIIAAGDPTIAYDSETGKEIWSCKGMRPMCAPSPVFDGSLVWVTSGRNGPTMTIDPTGAGDVSETHGKLLADSGGPYVPSPVLCPFLMLPGDDGKIAILDKSGKVVLRTNTAGHFTASPLAADGKIYWSDEKGRTYVLNAGGLTAKDFRAEIIAVNDLGETILASPAASNGKLYLRTVSSLYCIAGTAKTVAQTSAPASTQAQATLAELRQRYQKFQAEEGSDIPIRLEIVDIVSALKDPLAVGFLLEIVQKDNHWDVTEAAAKAIAGRGADATDALLEMAGDRREYVKTISIDALGERKAVGATAKLLNNAADKGRLVRLSVLRALGRIGQAQDADVDAIFPVLITGLSDSESAVKVVAIQSLVELAPKAGKHRETIMQGLPDCASNKNADVSKASKDALAKAYRPEPGTGASRPAD